MYAAPQTVTSQSQQRQSQPHTHSDMCLREVNISDSFQEQDKNRSLQGDEEAEQLMVVVDQR